jgi:hypothetical protein
MSVINDEVAQLSKRGLQAQSLFLKPSIADGKGARCFHPRLWKLAPSLRGAFPVPGRCEIQDTTEAIDTMVYTVPEYAVESCSAHGVA